MRGIKKLAVAVGLVVAFGIGASSGGTTRTVTVEKKVPVEVPVEVVREVEVEVTPPACADALLLAIKSEAVLKRAYQAIINGNTAAFNRAFANYISIGGRWAQAANSCDPGGGYTFGDQNV